MSKQPHRSAKEKNPSSELEKERLSIQALLTRGEDDHWQIGVHYNRIVENHLAEKSHKYKTAREFFASAFSAVPKSTLSLYGKIAKAFSEKVAKQYGVSALRALLTYEKLSDSKLLPGDPGNISIPIPQKDGSTKNKHFADCTYEELKAAIGHHQRPTAPLDPYDQEILDQINKAIQDTVGDAPLIVMKAHPSPRDGVTVNFSVPIEHLDDLHTALGKALGKAKQEPPAPEDGWKPNWQAVEKFGKVLKKAFDGEPKSSGSPPRKQTKRRGRPHARA
jgi:hypothetical protein